HPQLFDTTTVFENYPTKAFGLDPAGPRELTEEAGDEPRLEGISGRDAYHYPLRLVAAADDGLLLRIEHFPGAVDHGTAEACLEWLRHALGRIADDPELPVEALLRNGLGPDAPALPKAPIEGRGAPLRTPAAPREPSGALESSLCAHFAHVLGRDKVGAEQDFFELGGDSLLALRLAGRIGTETGKKPPLRTLFAARTPALLARLLGS
ncbi:phosphopantetheine-binding protein, partial [Streptomyces sodiiphilus]|uniref:phosphopantetheine-binding protein n=1 Tax=Streptomyces sodiiphilus TaxID=226217 RepID=UPI0031DD01B5